MKIIYNKLIPFKGYSAVNIFSLVFARKENNPLSDTTKNHERIHTVQGKWMLWVFFYLWYGIEWLIRLVQYRDIHKAYRNISFEREAYANQGEISYLSKRKPYAFVKYLKAKISDDSNN